MAHEERILETVRRVWGFESLRPIQSQAIEASLAARDSLVVMPTGGGKSLCYQVPPLLTDQLTIVASPLIALMKDQVDGLRSVGYPAVALHSGLSPDERRDAERGLAQGQFKLVFVAPERLINGWFLNLAKRMDVRSFAIDEAHCISHWGHDFRPEYRQLAVLRDHFPKVNLHAYTATATPRVQRDIVTQLGLRDPALLVGTFDRPNLTYRILPLVDARSQTLEVIARHAGEAVIVYCISRRDTELMAQWLSEKGVKAGCYHAGLDKHERRKTQDAFSAEELDVVVATVAFGMGIDRSNVRCVLHTAMPKSVEHYQQETGRAGRDGLPAECVLLYSAAHPIKWESLIARSAAEADEPGPIIEAQTQLLRQMQKLCGRDACRHKSLTEYFGQAFAAENCGACDVCLNEVQGMADSTVTAQKILSCVARTGNRFGVGHVVDVLLGADTQRVRDLGHDKLSTYGLLKDQTKKALTNMVYQLVDQELLDRTADDKPILQLNAESWRVMKGQRKARLFEPKARAPRQSRADTKSWEGVDAGLAEHLRQLRRKMAQERAVPAYVIFDDNTLRDLARRKPVTLDALRSVHGIGEKRLAEVGEVLVNAIVEHTGESEPTRKKK